MKEAHAQLICLYENHLEILKEKIQGNKKDEVFSIAQREAVIKQLKKENTQFKAKITKMKAK